MPVEGLAEQAAGISDPAGRELRGDCVEAVIVELGGKDDFVIKAAEIGVDGGGLRGVDGDGGGDLGVPSASPRGRRRAGFGVVRIVRKRASRWTAS